MVKAVHEHIPDGDLLAALSITIKLLSGIDGLGCRAFLASTHDQCLTMPSRTMVYVPLTEAIVSDWILFVLSQDCGKARGGLGRLQGQFSQQHFAAAARIGPPDAPHPRRQTVP
jgi:hypothetical protein